MDITKSSGSATTSRRQRQIEDCLYENLLHTPYTSVSISDLCHQLGLSRKSFYNYYADKDSCFRAILSRRIQEFMLQLTAVSIGDDDTELIATMLAACRDNKAFFDILVRNNLLFFLMDQVVHYLLEIDRSLLEYINTPQFQDDPYILSSFVSANVTFIIQWYLHNFDTPLEEMVGKYQRLIHQPLIPLE